MNFCPNVPMRTGIFARVQDVIVIAGVGSLSGVCIPGGDEAVQIWGGGIAEELLRIRLGARLREVVVLQLDVEDVADGRSRDGRTRRDQAGGEP